MRKTANTQQQTNRVALSTRKDTVRAIHLAFSSVRPIPAEDLSWVDSHPELDQIQHSLAMQDWANLEFKAVRSNKDSLPLLSDRAFQGYIAAFLIAALTRRRRELDVLWDNILTTLSPHKANTRLAARRKRLSKQQRKAIARFLVFFEQQERWECRDLPHHRSRAEAAIRYWSS